MMFLLIPSHSSVKAKSEIINPFLSSSLLQMGTGVWTPDGVTERSVLWVTQVWQQLNACLSRLGTHEALLGPQLFLSCPVVPNNTQAIVRYVSGFNIILNYTPLYSILTFN